MRLVNIAHGDLIVLSAYVALVVTQTTGLDPFLSLLIVVPVMFALGYALQRGLLNQTLSGGLLPPLLVTFGISIIIQNGLLQGFGAYDHRLQEGADRNGESAFSGWPVCWRLSARGVRGGRPRHRRFAALVLPHPAGPRFSRRLRRCRYRRADGYRQPKLYALALGIAMIFTALAGVLFGIRTIFAPSSGPIRLILAFEAVIIGGLGSMWGTLIGGMVLGLAQAIGAALDPTWQILAGHLAFLAILIVRPERTVPADEGLTMEPVRVERATRASRIFAFCRLPALAALDRDAVVGRRRRDAAGRRNGLLRRAGAALESACRLCRPRVRRPTSLRRASADTPCSI